MRTILVVGVGLAGPGGLTLQAAEALGRADVVFATEKGTAADDLVALRREVVARHAPRARIVAAPDPPRDRDTPGYREAVAEWTSARAGLYAAMIDAELADGGCGAFLAWGDPAFYDSTIRVLDEVRASGLAGITLEVFPGVSSLQALAAAHRISLTRVGAPLLVTTGRRLADEGVPAGVDDVVVMLDGGNAFERVDPAGWVVYWGAYLGGPDEIVVSGPLAEVAAQIVARREQARAAKGWVMDIYLLRRETRRLTSS